MNGWIMVRPYRQTNSSTAEAAQAEPHCILVSATERIHTQSVAIDHNQPYCWIEELRY